MNTNEMTMPLSMGLGWADGDRYWEEKKPRRRKTLIKIPTLSNCCRRRKSWWWGKKWVTATAAATITVYNPFGFCLFFIANKKKSQIQIQSRTCFRLLLRDLYQERRIFATFSPISLRLLSRLVRFFILIAHSRPRLYRWRLQKEKWQIYEVVSAKLQVAKTILKNSWASSSSRGQGFPTHSPFHLKVVLSDTSDCRKVGSSLQQTCDESE